MYRILRANRLNLGNPGKPEPVICDVKDTSEYVLENHAESLYSDVYNGYVS